MARTKKGFAMSAQKIKTKMKNDITFASYFEMLKSLAEHTFKWNNVPNDIDPTFIEKALFNYGMVAVFHDPIVGLIALPAMQSGGFNIYGEPKMIRAFSPRTGFSQLLKYSPDLNATECVLIHNTCRDLNSSLFKATLGMYAERLAEMKRTEDVNVYAQRTPVTMVVPEGQVETYTNLLDRYENFGKIILGYKGLDVDSVKALSTLAPWVADNVDQLFVKTWNEAMNFLGISNVGVSKKERITENESVMSMGSTYTFRQTRKEPREFAISRINEKYGTNIEIDISEIVNNNEAEIEKAEVAITKELAVSALTGKEKETEETEND